MQQQHAVEVAVLKEKLEQAERKIVELQESHKAEVSRLKEENAKAEKSRNKDLLEWDKATNDQSRCL